MAKFLPGKLKQDLIMEVKIDESDSEDDKEVLDFSEKRSLGEGEEEGKALKGAKEFVGLLLPSTGNIGINIVEFVVSFFSSYRLFIFFPACSLVFFLASFSLSLFFFPPFVPLGFPLSYPSSFPLFSLSLPSLFPFLSFSSFLLFFPLPILVFLLVCLVLSSYFPHLFLCVLLHSGLLLLFLTLVDWKTHLNDDASPSSCTFCLESPRGFP